jgi:hypothetical protein
VLEKHSTKAIAIIALATLAFVLFQLSSIPVYSEEMDSFGVEKLYPTAAGGNEWYVNMEDPRDDPNFRNLGNVHFSKNSDGSWKVSADQIRMEAWSPANEKWLNVEITEYAKIESGSNELLQMYSRGGHHTLRDECLGSAYKARLYGDGTSAWNKEVTHPAYAGNRAETRATTESLSDRWIGFKAIIYNVVEDGKTYVRLESYIDDDVTDANGNLVVKNNWKLASVYEDKGGWTTNNSDFNTSCFPVDKDSDTQYRQRDEIINMPGGTSTQNIAAFRSDDLTWSFKYLSVREIDPSGQTVSAPDDDSKTPTDTSDSDSLCSTDYCQLVTSQHVQNDGNITEVRSIDLSLKKSSTRADGSVIVGVVQGGYILTSNTIDTNDLTTFYGNVTAQFSQPAEVAGTSFDIVVMYVGTGYVTGSVITTN